MSKLDSIKQIQSLRDILTENQVTNWITEQTDRAKRVALYREYARGEHRVYLTAKMKTMLNLTDGSNTIHSQLNANNMGIVIDTMVDRLEVTGIDAVTDATETGAAGSDTTASDAGDDDINAWLESVSSNVRFDALQGAVHEATVRDGESYLMVTFDNEAGAVQFHHEPAYDGREGMVAVYRTLSSRTPDAAIKLWSDGDDTRINVYYPDRVEKYIVSGTTNAAGTPMPYLGDEATGDQGHISAWAGAEGAIGLPVIHFMNRRKSYQQGGESELLNAIPLQDLLNRQLYSVSAAAELTAFPVRWIKGAKPPAELSPGGFIEISPDQPLTRDEVAEVGVLEQGSLAPFLQAIERFTNDIGRITRTPSPDLMGSDTASGESLKQREIGLLGKIRRFQVSSGNAWEDTFALAHAVQSAFGTIRPPEYTRFNTQWRNAEIRNDKATIENAMMTRDLLGDRETLRIVGEVYGYDEAKIDRIMDERGRDNAQEARNLQPTVPAFNALSIRELEPVDTASFESDNGLEAIGA